MMGHDTVRITLVVVTLCETERCLAVPVEFVMNRFLIAAMSQVQGSRRTRER